MVSTFEVIAQPTRRAILDRLREREQLVGDLAESLHLAQASVSKHLRVLREAGLVQARTDGPRRWYTLCTEPLVELDEWLQPYRWIWESRLDTLGTHLETMPGPPSSDTTGGTS